MTRPGSGCCPSANDVAPGGDRPRRARRTPAGRRLPARDRGHRRVRWPVRGPVPPDPGRAATLVRSAVIVFFGRFIPYVGGLVDDPSVALRDPGVAGDDRRIHPAGPDLDPQRDPGQVPGAGSSTARPSTSIPAIVLIALPAGAALAGIVGLFVAIPVVAFALAITGAAIGSSASIRRLVRPGQPARPDLARPARSVELAVAGRAGLLAVAIAAAVQVPIVVAAARRSASSWRRPSCRLVTAPRGAAAGARAGRRSARRSGRPWAWS